jgi:hypothetical protein
MMVRLRWRVLSLKVGARSAANPDAAQAWPHPTAAARSRRHRLNHLRGGRVVRLLLQPVTVKLLVRLEDRVDLLAARLANEHLVAGAAPEVVVLLQVRLVLVVAVDRELLAAHHPAVLLGALRLRLADRTEDMLEAADLVVLHDPAQLARRRRLPVLDQRVDDPLDAGLLGGDDCEIVDPIWMASPSASPSCSPRNSKMSKLASSPAIRASRSVCA